MKRLTLAILLATGFALTLMVSVVLSRDFSSDNTITPSPAPTAVTKSDEAKIVSGYIVGVYDGKVAVFSSSGDLEEVYDVYVSTLPEYDREQLRIGVRAEDANSLRALIEDYTS